MKRELQQLEQSPPHGVSCWMKNDSIEQLEARKKSLRNTTKKVKTALTGDAVNSFHRDTFSTCRYCACAKQYFTVCIVRCVYRAELILGR